MNIYLPPGQKEKQHIHILTKPPKMVRIVHFKHSYTQFSCEDILYMSYLAAPVLSQGTGSFHSSAALRETGYVLRPDSSSILRNPITSAAASSWTNSKPAQTVGLSHVAKGSFIYVF